jgi:exopolysaccharide biosynthesis protein PssK
VKTPTAPQTDAQLVASLQAELDHVLSNVLEGASQVALLDLPYHRNAGDAAIWLGERATLKRLGITVVYLADAGRYDARRLRERLPDGPILLHGGGSVGDLWPWPQELRERVLRDLPGRRVIQLGQSVHFGDPARRAHFAEVVTAHGDYVFLARDAASAERAASFSPAQVHLVPDFAFGLGVLPRPTGGTGVLALARDDHESSSGLRETAAAHPGIRLADWSLGRWGDIGWQARRLAPRVLRPTIRSAGTYAASRPLMDAAMESMVRQVLRKGTRLLGAAEVVVTDRLHAHILCTLMGIPHVVLDNSYGKIRALHDLWTADSRTTHWADDPGAAFERASRLLPTPTAT